MFSPIHSSALGKSSCGCTKGNPYTPSNSGIMDVSFLPIKNTTGTANYVALIDNENEKSKISIPKEMSIEDEYEDYNSCSEYSDENNTKLPDMFDLENDYVKTFYIGSITIVGLYILYRILDKSK
jgi:hypothetical protein